MKFQVYFKKKKKKNYFLPSSVENFGGLSFSLGGRGGCTTGMKLLCLNTDRWWRYCATAHLTLTHPPCKTVYLGANMSVLGQVLQHSCALGEECANGYNCCVAVHCQHGSFPFCCLHQRWVCFLDTIVLPVGLKTLKKQSGTFICTPSEYKSEFVWKEMQTLDMYPNGATF